MERMLRRSWEGDSEMPRSKMNPFKSPSVIRAFMKNVELTKVKELRKVCYIWDKVGVVELEKRALQGTINPINLAWRWDLKPKKPQPPYSVYPERIPLTIQELEVKLEQFLEDTKQNPKIFRGFHFNYAQFIHVIKRVKFHLLLSEICFLGLKFNANTLILAEGVQLLNSFLDEVAPQLFGLELTQNQHYDQSDRLEDSSVISPGSSARFPRLQKFILEGKKSMEFFKDIFMGGFPASSCKSLIIGDLGDENLGYLLKPTRNWSQLTHLDIGGEKSQNYDDFYTMFKRTSWINSLAYDAGMALKSFSIQLGFYDDEYLGEDTLEIFLQICANLTAFFATQANSLEDLSIMFNIEIFYKEIETDMTVNSLKITLPVFKSLRRLKICNYSNAQLNGENTSNFLSFHSYSVNFPQLEDLTILGEWEVINNCGGVYKEGLTLKRLKVSDGREASFFLGKKIRSLEDDKAHLLKDVTAVEALEVGETAGWSGDFFLQDGEELPWNISLKVLHIYRISKPLKLGLLKGLKTIVIDHSGIELLDTGVPKGFGERMLSKILNVFDSNDPDYKRFLDLFIHIAKMDLDLIKFRGFKMSQKIRKEFVKFFPFRVEFDEKPVSNWNKIAN